MCWCYGKYYGVYLQKGGKSACILECKQVLYLFLINIPAKAKLIHIFLVSVSLLHFCVVLFLSQKGCFYKKRQQHGTFETVKYPKYIPGSSQVRPSWLHLWLPLGNEVFQQIRSQAEAPSRVPLKDSQEAQAPSQGAISTPTPALSP